MYTREGENKTFKTFFFTVYSFVPIKFTPNYLQHKREFSFRVILFYSIYMWPKINTHTFFVVLKVLHFRGDKVFSVVSSVVSIVQDDVDNDDDDNEVGNVDDEDGDVEDDDDRYVL